MFATDNIYLSPLLEEDSSMLFKWINDRDLVHFNNYYKPISPESHKEWFQSIQKRNDFFIFGIRLKETNEIIGTCQLHSVSYIDRVAELQIRIGETQKMSKGFGTQAVKLLLEFAFNDLNLNKVYLTVLSENHRAIKAYLNAGFKKEGLLEKHCHINGKYRDLVIMGILRD